MARVSEVQGNAYCGIGKGHRVIAVAAINGIGTRSTDKIVIAIAAIDRIIAAFAKNRIITGITINCVVINAALDVVVTFSTVDIVVVGAA